MPIRPENKHLYPKDWKLIREKILIRADNKCEWPGCGVQNHSLVERIKNGISKMVKVVLTIAHKDHDPTNSDPDNLAAWCQLHHNQYDAKTRAKNRKLRLEREQQQKSTQN